MIRRLSLKECWKYGKEDLVPNARTFWKVLKSFIKRKACNTAQYYYWLDHNNFSKPFLFIEMHFWCLIEYHIRYK